MILKGRGYKAANYCFNRLLLEPLDVFPCFSTVIQYSAPPCGQIGYGKILFHATLQLVQF